MASIKQVAMQFFEACETGKGWEGCKAYCKPDATFSAQAEPLADVRTVQAYADWMQGTVKMLPDASYELKSFATDDQRANVTAYAVFSGHAHRGRRTAAHRQADKFRLRLLDGFRRRQNSSHDEDLECRLGHERARLGLSPWSPQHGLNRVKR